MDINSIELGTVVTDGAYDYAVVKEFCGIKYYSRMCVPHSIDNAVVVTDFWENYLKKYCEKNNIFLDKNTEL